MTTTPAVTPQCDRCIAIAVITYVTPRGPLEFCEHHARQHQPALTALGYPSSPIAGRAVYLPAGWESCGYGLPVNGPDRHHHERFT